MNTRCPSVALHAVTPPAKPRVFAGAFESLERLINTASFVSVDLADTVFVSLHEQRDREAEAAAKRGVQLR